MIFLLAAVVLLLAVGVAAVLAATGVTGSRGEGSDRVGVPALVPVVGVVVAVPVVLIVAVLGLGGLRSSAGRPEVPSGPPRPEPDPETDAPIAIHGPAATFEGTVTIDIGGSDVRPLPAIGGLEEGDVVYVAGAGFLDHADGVVAQCDRRDAATCRNVLPILTDGEGRLRVPYRVEGPTSGGLLVVEVDFDRGAARLGFGAVPRTTTLVVSDDHLAVRDAPPGQELSVVRCPTDAADLGACDTVGRVRVAVDGTATARVEPARDSMVTVTDDTLEVLAEPVRLLAARRSAAEVDLAPSQLAGGFGVALLLVAVGIALVRTTDWRAPAEAATPFLDAAPLEP